MLPKAKKNFRSVPAHLTGYSVVGTVFFFLSPKCVHYGPGTTLVYDRVSRISRGRLLLIVGGLFLLQTKQDRVSASLLLRRRYPLGYVRFFLALMLREVFVVCVSPGMVP